MRMSVKLSYYVKGHCQTIEDATLVKEKAYCDLGDEYSIKSLVVDVCEYAWLHNDGWEWLRSGSVISLVIDDVLFDDFEIEVESEPVFSCRRQEGSK